MLVYAACGPRLAEHECFHGLVIDRYQLPATIMVAKKQQ